MFEDNAQAGLLMQMFITYAQTQNPHHHPARPRKPMRRGIDDRAFRIRPVQHEGRAGKRASGTCAPISTCPKRCIHPASNSAERGAHAPTRPSQQGARVDDPNLVQHYRSTAAQKM